MTIDDVTRLPGGAKTAYAQGNTYPDIHFNVHFSNGYAEAAILLNTDDRLPKIGWTFGEEDGAISTDTSVVAKAISVNLAPGSVYTSDGKGIAIYSVEYGQLTPQFAVNPIDRKDVNWGGSDITRVPLYDREGTRLNNSAGLLYTGIPAFPIRAGSVVIVLRQLENPADVVIEYSNSVNGSPIWGLDKGEALMGKIMARKTQEGAQSFWEISFPINILRDGWNLKMFDAGLVYKDDDGQHLTATDPVGNPKPEPTLLDGNGQPLDPPDSTPIIFPKDGYEIYEQTDWNGLGLPNPFDF